MKSAYDLVVIGAGPAGLTAAKFAAENGLSIALLERKDTIHEVLRMCGMMLVTLSGSYMGERLIYNEELKRISFPHHGFSVKYEGPTKDFYAWEIYSPGGEKITFGDYATNVKKGKAGRATAVYDKSAFLRGLAEECRHLGVNIYTGANVVDVRKSGDMVNVLTAEGIKVKAPFVIAADGRISRTARILGMNKNRRFFGTVASWAYEMTNLDLPSPYALIQPLVQGGDPPMLGFIIPRAWKHNGEDLWLVMVSDTNPSNDHEALCEYFIQNSRFASWFKRAKRIRKLGVCGNMYGPIVHPCKDNVIFAGDAGWCQEAEMSGAVMCGWKAGTTVSFALQEGLLNEDGTQPYLEWWKKYHLDTLDYTVFLKNLAMPILCTDREIDYIFSKIKDTLPTLLDPYEVPRHMGSAIARVIPEIQAERPDLLKKLEGFASLPAEVMLKNTIRAGFNGSFSI